MIKHLRRDAWKDKFYEIARIKNVDELWSSFKTMLLELKTLYVPKLTESLKNSGKKKEASRLIRR